MLVDGARSGLSPRSYLYVPADQPERLAKALQRGADAIIIDLEDSVAHASKARARELAGSWIGGNRAALSRVWVRINADDPEADLAAVVAPIAGVMLPRSEVALLTELDGLLTTREAQFGVPLGSLQVIGLIETARGLLDAVEVASAPRTTRLGIGRADLAGELGLHLDHDGPEFRSIMLQLVIASSAARIAAPVAPTSTDFRDLEALRASTEQLLRLGYCGRTAIHPAQVPVINEVFTPSKDEVDRARQLVEAFDAVLDAGIGVMTDDDGRMVDAAVVRGARDVLARAEACSSSQMRS